MRLHTPKEFGFLIKDSRTRRGLTQASLANQVGVSRKWIVDLESGKATAELGLVLRTLRALGLELDAREQSDAFAKGDIDIDAIVEAARRKRR